MNYNNFSSKRLRIAREANRNFTEYQQFERLLSSISEQDKLYSNLSDVENMINTMKEDRDIENGSLDDKIVSSSYDGMLQIYSKKNYSSEDVLHFYSHYKNVKNIYNNKRGEQSD